MTIVFSRHELRLEKMAALEIELRKELLEELLEMIRILVREKAIIQSWSNSKNTHDRAASSKQVFTRSFSDGYKVEQLLLSYRDSFNRSREALKSLAIDVKYAQLEPRDIKAADLGDHIQLGERSRSLSWIWTTPRMDSSDPLIAQEWTDRRMHSTYRPPYILTSSHTTVNRLNWFEARANAHRHAEEIDILRGELSRCKTTFQFQAETWSQLLMKDPKSRRDFGLNAYIHRTVSNFTALRNSIQVDGSGTVV